MSARARKGIVGLVYCLGNGLPLGVESARGFVSDAVRRGLAPDGVAWNEALD